MNAKKFHDDVRKSLTFKDVKAYKNEYFESNKLFIQVLEGLHAWTKDDEKFSVIKVKKALEKAVVYSTVTKPNKIAYFHHFHQIYSI